MMEKFLIKTNLMFGTKKIKEKVITQKLIHILMLKQSRNTMFRGNITTTIMLF